jgi:surface polysaccharide O-acyltransferase-like enzyme
MNFSLGKSYDFLTAWWLPFNFTPYIFSSYIISEAFSGNRFSFRLKSFVTIVILLIISVFFILIEWNYLNIHGQWYFAIIPQYARLSLVFSSLALTWLSLYIRQTPRFVELVSEYSLGIYCLHFIIIDLFNQIEFSNWRLPGENIILFFLTIIIAMILTKLFKKINLAKGLI